MGKPIKAEFFNEGAMAIERIGEITERKWDEVISDALNTYLWILYEQMSGRKIFSVDGLPGEQSELEHFVKNPKAAERYFKELGW